MDPRLRGYVLTALFAGTAAAVGYLLLALPNVEALTAVLFVAGWTLGWKRGVAAAVIAMLLYSGFNPQGTFPPLLAAQILGSAAAPLAGSALYRCEGKVKRDRFIFSLTAIIITLWYDLLTNLAYPLVAGFDWRGIATTLAMGIPFSLIHIGGNALIFWFVVPVLLNVVRQYRC